MPTASPGAANRFEAVDLAARRGDLLLFKDLSFALGAGDALVLTGPNGSGKSTLLRVAALFMAPAAGRLVWNGASIASDPDAHRARLHYLGHREALKPSLTPAETWRFWRRLAGQPEASAAPALDRLGLAALHDLPCRHLSAGQRRRLTLTRLLAVSAPLWLLDEPTVGLDRDGIGLLAALIEAHRAAGGLVIAATHQPLPLGDAATLDLGAARPRRPAKQDDVG